MASQMVQIKDLKLLLEKHFQRNVEIIKYDSKLLTAPGENYGSLMLAVDLTIKKQNMPQEVKHFVAKMRPQSEILCKMFNIQKTFKKELYFYIDAIPALAAMEQEYGIQEYRVSDMFAKCYGGRINLNPDSDIVDEDAILLLENLKISGFANIDRLIGFDLQQTHLIINDLARFHAVFIILKKLKPEVFVEKVLPCIQQVQLGDFGKNAMELFIMDVKNILQEDEECAEYLDKIEKSMIYHLTGPFRKSDPQNPFSTVVHTDYWVNNTMLLCDSKGRPVENKIVDLQLLMYNSGIHDLLFFLFTSVMPSVLYSNVDKLFHLYHESFIKCLKEYNVNTSEFSWDAFNNEIIKIAPKEIGHILCMYRPILTERGEITNMASFDEDSLHKKLAVSGNYATRVRDTARYFINRGWI